MFRLPLFVDPVLIVHFSFCFTMVVLYDHGFHQDVEQSNSSCQKNISENVYSSHFD